MMCEPQSPRWNSCVALYLTQTATPLTHSLVIVALIVLYGQGLNSRQFEDFMHLRQTLRNVRKDAQGLNWAEV